MHVAKHENNMTDFTIYECDVISLVDAFGGELNIITYTSIGPEPKVLIPISILITAQCL